MTNQTLIKTKIILQKDKNI